VVLGYLAGTASRGAGRCTADRAPAEDGGTVKTDDKETFIPVGSAMTGTIVNKAEAAATAANLRAAIALERIAESLERIAWMVSQ
jgi:hypothetical protein